MQLTAANLSFFFTAMETRFWQAYKATQPWSSQIATTYPVGTEQWVSGWTGMLEKMREWVGPRIVRTPAPQTYLVPMQIFELTWGIDKFKLKWDQHGIYGSHFQHHGTQNAKWPDYQLRDLIFGLGSQIGPRQLGVDGLTHWNTAHPVDVYDAGKGTYSNDFRGGGIVVDGVNVGGAVSVNGFNTLYNEMGNRKSESGEALGINPDLVVSSTFNRASFAVILNSQFIAPAQIGSLGTGPVGTANAPFVGAMNNPLVGWCDTLIAPDFGITAATKPLWLMLQTKGTPVQPFSWLVNQAPILTPRTNPDDPVVFDTKQFVYGSEAVGAPAWALPFLSSISGG